MLLEQSGAVAAWTLDAIVAKARGLDMDDVRRRVGAAESGGARPLATAG